MIEGSLSRRYTKALFQLARDAGQEEKIGQEVEQFYAAYSQTELQQVLNNPAFALEARKLLRHRKVWRRAALGDQRSFVCREVLVQCKRPF